MASLSVGGDGLGGNSLNNGREELKSQFTTREGTYRLVSTVELTRNTRPLTYVGNNTGPASTQGSIPPVRLSFVTLTSSTNASLTGYENGMDHSGGEDGSEHNSTNILYHTSHRICVNIGKELFVYPYLGCRKSVDLTKTVDKRVYKGTNPTYHEFSEVSACQDNLLLLIGFTGGQVQLVDPVTKEVNKLYNEERLFDKSRVTCVRWIPNSASQFLVSHSSGNMYLYNVDGICPAGTVTQFTVAKTGPSYTVSHCKGKTQRNPLTKWTVGDGAINEFAFSPCGLYLAVVSQDGFLRIFKYETYELVGVTRSYFGGLICAAWSPDGKYICVGGEDDLVTLWSFKERRVVARGQGHKSWVSVVAFDPYTTTYGDGDMVETSGISSSAVNTSGVPRVESSSSGVFSELPASKSNHINHNNNSNPSAPININNNKNSNNNTATSSVSNPSVLRVSRTSESMRLSVSETRTQTCYRIGSVGQDTQLCLWDLTEDVLKQHFGKSSRIPPSSNVALPSTSSAISNSSHHGENETTGNHHSSSGSSSGGGILNIKLPFIKEHKRNNSSSSNSNKVQGNSSTGGTDDPIKLIGTQACPRLDECPLLEPLICKKISHERLSSLLFREESILTLCQDGILCTWARPGDLGSQL